MEPKSIPKGVKIEGDFQERKDALQDRLGEVLEPSWNDLGSSWVPSWGQNRAVAHTALVFFENRFFEEDKRSRRVLDRTWLDLGAKRLQKGGQKGPKRHPKRDQNDIKILIDFGIDFGPILEAQEIRCSLGGGMRGAWLDSFDFEEFEDKFENCLDTLRPFGWRRI